jgi:tetratricopeptide (TPR) repeat protein
MLVSVTGAVFADGFSTFLGLSRTRLNWGSMIYDSFTYQAVNATITWNVLIPSAMAISLFAAAFYMIARGVHEVAEPRLRTRGHLVIAHKAKTLRPTQPPMLPSETPALIPKEGRLETTATIEDTAPVRVARQPLQEQGRTTGVSIPTSVTPRRSIWLAAQADLAQARQALQQGAPTQAAGHYGHLIQNKLLLPEVIQELSFALERYPADASLWQALGDAHLRSGNLPQALEAYNKALGLITYGN